MMANMGMLDQQTPRAAQLELCGLPMTSLCRERVSLLQRTLADTRIGA
jgi:hypothetical protein